MVNEEILGKRRLKLRINGQTACIWAISFNDVEIWEEKSNEAAVYLHRIATDPVCRGRNFVSTIVDRALSCAKDNSKKYVRLDTCGYNKSLIDHYTKNGFHFLGTRPVRAYK